MSDSSCRHCGAAMRAGANYCNSCGHYQNWRRHLSFGSNVLPLLVALSSIVTLGIAEINDAFTVDRTDIHAAHRGFGGGVKDKNNRRSNRTFTFTIWNTGNQFGELSEVALRLKYSGQDVTEFPMFATGGSAFIHPGAVRRIAFAVIWKHTSSDLPAEFQTPEWCEVKLAGFDFRNQPMQFGSDGNRLERPEDCATLLNWYRTHKSSS